MIHAITSADSALRAFVMSVTSLQETDFVPRERRASLWPSVTLRSAYRYTPLSFSIDREPVYREGRASRPHSSK
jgi:hypothetical protein